MPGREKEAKKAGEEGYETVRAKAQSMVCTVYFPTRSPLSG